VKCSGNRTPFQGPRNGWRTQLLINAVTVRVGTGTNLSGLPTNQELPGDLHPQIQSSHKLVSPGINSGDPRLKLIQPQVAQREYPGCRACERCSGQEPRTIAPDPEVLVFGEPARVSVAVRANDRQVPDIGVESPGDGACMGFGREKPVFVEDRHRAASADAQHDGQPLACVLYTSNNTSIMPMNGTSSAAISGGSEQELSAPDARRKVAD
jgi:hypothetical protein